jgi:lipoprotein-anchoring transpeptidase ErfK/SrfK
VSREWLRRGQQALRAGRRIEARQALRAAVAADPTNADAWLLLARLSAPRARLAYTARALELEPQHRRAHQELRRARRLSLPSAGGAAALPVPALGRPTARLGPARLLLVALATALALLSLPALALRAGTVLAHPRLDPAGAGPAVARLLAQLSLITATPTASQTNTPSPTATPTATATSTPSPTATATPTPTLTPEPPTATPAASVAGERWIDVDLSDQRVVAYEGQVAVNTFIVSTGVWQYPTVTGQFHIYVKYEAADMAGPGYYLPSVPYVMYFYQSYGLHGTYWHNNFGTPMSHGCVNLRTDDAAWLFQWASVGTPVNVHE